MRRAVHCLAVLLVCASAVPAAAGRPASRVRGAEGLEWVPADGRGGPPRMKVPVPGTGSSVVVAVPGMRGDEDLATLGVTVTRHDRPDPPAGPAGPVDEDPSVAPPPTDHGPARRDEAAEYPAGASREPGTVTSIGGGDCDGYPVREATIHPARLGYAPDGTLFWADNDLDRSRHWYFGAGYGSVLLRYADKAGRVRTLSSLLAPEEGRIPREEIWSSYLVGVIPDATGGVLVNITAQSNQGTFQKPGTSSPDVPGGGAIVRVGPGGDRTLLAGGEPQFSPSLTSHVSDEPAIGAPIGQIQSFATDDAGNLYLVDSASLNGALRSTAIRFVNRGREAVTFYAGTEWEKTVEPGDIGTIAGGNPATLGGVLDQGGVTDIPANQLNFVTVPRVVVRGSLLYYLNTNRVGAGTGPVVDVINLGSEPATTHGVATRPGYASRVAGIGSLPAGYAGDGGPAKLARFNVDWLTYSGDFVLTADGTMYVADTMNHRIRAIDPRLGLIRTVAGNGLHGYDGDGQLALTTRLYHPFGLAVDPQDRVVFSDSSNAVVRRIEPSGVLRTIAGRGLSQCGEGHLATGATVPGGAYLGHLGETSTDSRGNLYAVLKFTQQVVRRSPDGVLRVVAGRPQRCAGWFWGFSPNDPQHPCPLGVSDGDGGPVTAARFADPVSILVDAYDNLYVTDLDRLRYVNLGTEAVVVHGVRVEPGTVATLRTFPARLVRLTIPGIGLVEATMPIGDLALDDHGNLYVADTFLHVIYRLGPCSDFTVVAGNGLKPVIAGDGDGGPPTAGSITPGSLAYDRQREILMFTDRNPDDGYSYSVRIRAVNVAPRQQRYLGQVLEAGTMRTIAGAGTCPRDGTIDGGASRCSYGDGRPAYQAVIGATNPWSDGDDDIEPQGMLTLGPGGRLYVLDIIGQRIRMILPDGRMAGLGGPWPEGWTYGSLFYTPFGYAGDGGRAQDAWFPLTPFSSMSFDARGDLVVATSHRLRKVADPLRAQLRLSSKPPGIIGAGKNFSHPVLLQDGLSKDAGLEDGTTAPEVVLTGGVPYVVARRGTGRGCDLWRISVGSEAKGGDRGDYRGQPIAGAAGAGPGGSGCALAGDSAGLAAAMPVRSRDQGADDRELGILTGRSGDAGASWSVDATAGLADRLGGTDLGDVAVARTATGYEMAYRVSATEVAVAASPDGVRYAAVARIPAAALRVGSLVTGPDGTRYLGLLLRTYSATGDPSMAVAVARSSDGRAWEVATVSTVPQDRGTLVEPLVGRPSIAVDASGAVYAAWNDLHGVRLAHSTDRGARWSPPAVVPGGSANVLPTVTAGKRGEVALAFYGTPMPRAGSAANPYAYWYVYVSRSSNALSAAPAFRSELATTSPVHVGTLCPGPCAPPAEAHVTPLVVSCLYTSRCPAGGAAAAAAFGSSPLAVGEVQARLGAGGTVHVAFTTSPGLLGNENATTAINYIRSCTGTAACRRATSAKAGSPGSGRVPPTGPIGLPAVGACATPPPFRPPAEPPAPAPAPPDPPAAAPQRPVAPPRAAVPPVLLPPQQPAPPANQNPVQSQQGARAEQQQLQQQQSVQGQAGLAPDEEEQPEPAVAGETVLLAAALMTTAAAAFARRRQLSVEYARMRR